MGEWGFAKRAEKSADKVIKGLAAGLVALIMVSVIGVFAFQGCAGKEMAPETQTLIFREAGFNAATYALKDQSRETVLKAEIAVEGAQALMGDSDPHQVARLILDFIDEFPLEDKHETAVLSAARLLEGLLTTDILIPENYQHSAEAVKAFLEGASEGIERLKTKA